MLTGTTFDAVVSNFTAVLDPGISSAGIVQGYGFAVNGCAFMVEDTGMTLQPWILW